MRKAFPSGHPHARSMQSNPMGQDMHGGQQSSRHGGHQPSRHGSHQPSAHSVQQSSRHGGHQSSRHGRPPSHAGQSSRHGTSAAQTRHLNQFNGPPGPSPYHSQATQFAPPQSTQQAQAYHLTRHPTHHSQAPQFATPAHLMQPAQPVQNPEQYIAPQPGTGPEPGPREYFMHPDFPGRVLCGHRIEVIPDDMYAPAYEELFWGNRRMKINRDAESRPIPRPPHLMKKRPGGDVRHMGEFPGPGSGKHRRGGHY